jgi:hypothetical protein
MATIEMGLDTFGDMTADRDGRLLPPAQVLRDVVAEAELADRVGVDFFGVGSTTARTSRSARRKWCWPRSPGEPGASGWARR